MELHSPDPYNGNGRLWYISFSQEVISSGDPGLGSQLGGQRGSGTTSNTENLGRSHHGSEQSASEESSVSIRGFLITTLPQTHMTANCLGALSRMLLEDCFSVMTEQVFYEKVENQSIHETLT